MVLLVLAIAWGAVLVFWIRSRSRGSFGDSVGTFHRHLHVLERTAPATLPPANRLRGPALSSTPLSSRLGRAAPTLPGAGPRVAAAAARRPVARRPMARRQPVYAQAPGVSSARRRQIRRRRRDVLFVLVVAVVATLVVAVSTGRHSLLLLQLATDVTLAGYVFLLVRLRNLALERQYKLRVLRRPALARYDAAGMPTGYGDLALRRVAN